MVKTICPTGDRTDTHPPVEVSKGKTLWGENGSWGSDPRLSPNAPRGSCVGPGPRPGDTDKHCEPLDSFKGIPRAAAALKGQVGCGCLSNAAAVRGILLKESRGSPCLSVSPSQGPGPMQEPLGALGENGCTFSPQSVFPYTDSTGGWMSVLSPEGQIVLTNA